MSKDEREMLSKSDQALMYALERGWSVSGLGGVTRPDGKLQTLQLAAKGYFCFSLVHNGRVRPIKVHRLAALQRFGPEALFVKGVMVRHLNNDKLDNSADNLALGTARDNHRDNSPALNERIVRAAQQANRRLTDSQALSVVARVAAGETQKSVAAELGVDRATVGNICSGRTYSNTTGVLNCNLN